MSSAHSGHGWILKARRDYEHTHVRSCTASRDKRSLDDRSPPTPTSAQRALDAKSFQGHHTIWRRKQNDMIVKNSVPLSLIRNLLRACSGMPITRPDSCRTCRRTTLAGFVPVAPGISLA